MKGSILVGGLTGFTAIFAGSLWYFQNYAYYSPVILSPTVQQEVVRPQPVTPETESMPSQSAGTQAPVAATPEVPGTLLTPTTTAPVVAADAEPTLPDATQQVSEATDPAQPAKIPETADETDIQVAALPGSTAIRVTRIMDLQPEVILAEEFKGIDASTSPLKFKACFTAVNSLPMMTETYVVYDEPTPLKAPVWFRCYRHKKITEALESGEAIAFLGEGNITYGVDRVVAVFSDGQAFAWHQINKCGTAAFSGEDLPAGCPPKPER